MASRSVAKSSLTCTGIFGSTAAGECIAPHWQLPTAATAEDRQWIPVDFLTHFRDTRGRFGHDEEKTWEATIGMNEKGGMNDEEFFKYIMTSIRRLYPDMSDKPGKRVRWIADPGGITVS